MALTALSSVNRMLDPTARAGDHWRASKAFAGLARDLVMLVTASSARQQGAELEGSFGRIALYTVCTGEDPLEPIHVVFEGQERVRACVGRRP